jgi:GAF domain-containing protein
VTDDPLRAVLAGQVLAGATARQELLQSIVDVARAIFLAKAASIAVLDERAGEFCFEAVAGEGGDTLLGFRFPAGHGIAGVVAQTGEPLIVDDLSGDPRFARGIAEGTGYVPRAMMVAPLLHEDDTLGTLSVLDRGRTGRSTMQELDLLVAFSDQAALALQLGEAARRAAAMLQGAEGDGDIAGLAALAGAVRALTGERHAAAVRMVEDLGTILRG